MNVHIETKPELKPLLRFLENNDLNNKNPLRAKPENQGPINTHEVLSLYILENNKLNNPHRKKHKNNGPNNNHGGTQM